MLIFGLTLTANITYSWIACRINKWIMKNLIGFRFCLNFKLCKQYETFIFWYILHEIRHHVKLLRLISWPFCEILLASFFMRLFSKSNNPSFSWGHPVYITCQKSNLCKVYSDYRAYLPWRFGSHTDNNTCPVVVTAYF